jgi:ribosomal 30S subunit maturation factor RimM
MSKQRDDTPEEIHPSGEEEEPERKPGSYYYDDSTGYEVYDPEKEDEEEGQEG